MNKKWIALASVLIFAIAGFFTYQYRPSKRFARHMIKARLFAREKSFLLAEMEYKAAYKAQGIKGGFSPTVSLEVLKMEIEWALTNKENAKALEYARAYVGLHPKDLGGMRLMARLAFMSGDVDAFFSMIQGVLNAEPTDFEARYFLAQVRMRQNRLDLAEEELAYLYRAHPDSIVTILPLAEVLLKRGNFVESRKLLNQVVKDRPKLALARMYLMDTYLLEQKMDSARGVLDQWSNDDKALEIPLLIRKAHLLSMENKLDEADQLLAPFHQADEKNLSALSEIALLYVKQGKYDSAYKVYVRIAEAKPADSRTPYLLASLILMANQQPAKALETLKSLQVGDKSQSLAFYISACYKSMDMINRADSVVPKVPAPMQPLLKEFQEQFPPEKAFLSRWARVNYFQLTEQNYWALVEADSLFRAYSKNPMATSMFAQRLSAIRQYSAAAEVQSKISKPTLRQRANLMELEINAGQLDKALVLAKEIHKEYPTMPGFSSVIGDIYMRTKQEAKATLAFEEELQIDSNNLVCLNNLAWEYGVKQGDLVKAMPYLEKLKAKNTSMDPRYFDTIGWVLAKLGKLPEAEIYLQRARNLSPGNPSLTYHMAWVKLKNGQPEVGKTLLQEALNSPAGFEEKAEAETLLAAGK